MEEDLKIVDNTLINNEGTIEIIQGNEEKENKLETQNVNSTEGGL